MFSFNEAPDFVGLGAEDPGLQGLVQKIKWSMKDKERRNVPNWLEYCLICDLSAKNFKNKLKFEFQVYSVHRKSGWGEERG